MLLQAVQPYSRLSQPPQKELADLEALTTKSMPPNECKACEGLGLNTILWAGKERRLLVCYGGQGE